ncbi:DUF6191 domain-containing protein [Streptomyces tritici]|uniref:DUF6191 domain-containing protein n=1 Tax=Streptomyces tritici TaxID=2054410 RepID=UPI003AF109B0
MQTIVFMTLPGLVVVLTVLAFVDQLLLRMGRAGVLPWRNGARQGQVAATGFEQLHASLSPGKAHELKERQSSLIVPDEEDDGAPPHRTTVDLTAGTAVVRLPRPGQKAGRLGRGPGASAVSAAPQP